MLTIHSRRESSLPLFQAYLMLQNYLNYSPIQEKKCFPLSSFSNLDQKRKENHDGAKLPQNAPLNDSTHVSPHFNRLVSWCEYVRQGNIFLQHKKFSYKIICKH